MDYSQLANDPDHPAGASPWNTSPRQSRGVSFSTSVGGSNPPSPLPAAQSDSQYSPEENQNDRGQFKDSGASFGKEQPQTSIQNNSLADPTQATAPLPDGGFAGPEQKYYQSIGQEAPLPHQARSQQEGNQDRQPLPSRYQSRARSAQRNTPHHKLQAKITGLERTGRKDPILKFDVHVGFASS